MSLEFGAAFCRAVEVPLDELRALLNLGITVAHADAPAVITAHAVYDDLSGYVVYVPLIGEDCDRHTKEAWSALNNLRAYLNSVAPGQIPPPVRPDADQRPPNYGLGGAGVLFGLGLGLFAWYRFGRK